MTSPQGQLSKLSPYSMQTSQCGAKYLRALQRSPPDNFRQVFHSIYESIHWPRSSVTDNAGQPLSG